MATPDSPLHAVDDDEAVLLEGRLRALKAFDAKYCASASSLRTMRGGLRRIARTFSEDRLDEVTFPWEAVVDRVIAQRLVDAVTCRYSRATASRDAEALKSMLRCLVLVGCLTRDEGLDALQVRGPAKRDDARPLAGRLIAPGELERLLQEAGRSTNKSLATRDVALIAVGASTGARRSELCSLRVADIDLDASSVFIENGKGGRSRYAWLHPTAVAALRMWFAVRGAQSGPLFNPVDRFGRISKRTALSDHQMWKVMRRLSAASEVEGVRPHDLRRFVVSNLLDKHDITLVSRTIGHAHINTTARYDRRGSDRQREAIMTLPLPDVASLFPAPRPPEEGGPS
jgi:integrase